MCMILTWTCGKKKAGAHRKTRGDHPQHAEVVGSTWRGTRDGIMGPRNHAVDSRFARERQPIFASFFRTKKRQPIKIQRFICVRDGSGVSDWPKVPQQLAGDSGPRSLSWHHLRWTSTAAVSTVAALLGRWGMEHVSMDELLFSSDTKLYTSGTFGNMRLVTIIYNILETLFPCFLPPAWSWSSIEFDEFPSYQHLTSINLCKCL